MFWFMRRSFVLAMLGCLPTAMGANAFGSDTKWVSGFGQGTKEALIQKGPSNEIYVACQEGSLSPSSISFSLAGKPPTGNEITVTFDALEPERISIWGGQVPSDCRACAGTFDYLRDKLKQHSSVHILFENGDGARFTLKGSSKAIGNCPSGF
jgi:hypothetical protein